MRFFGILIVAKSILNENWRILTIKLRRNLGNPLYSFFRSRNFVIHADKFWSILWNCDGNINWFWKHFEEILGNVKVTFERSHQGVGRVFYMEISGKLLRMDVTRILITFLGISNKSWMKLKPSTQDSTSVTPISLRVRIA